MTTLDPASLQRFQEEEALFKPLGTAIYGAPDRSCFSAIVVLACEEAERFTRGFARGE